jgi:hypothetical protein
MSPEILPIKKSVALLIRFKGESDEVLTCLRLGDDRAYPNMWGLPAVTVLPEETEFEAIDRIMRDKLRQRNYKIIRHLGKLTAPRRDSFLLILDEYEIEVEDTIFICNPLEYQKCQFQKPETLIPAANQGSLCSQICLNYFNFKY